MSKMIFFKPAKKWTSALPLGNGKIAAMVFGGVKSERIALNDTTLWSGYPRDYTNPNCAEALNEARELVFSKKYKDADAFIENNLHGEYSESYLPLGDILITATHRSQSGYSRELDLRKGVISVNCKGFSAKTFTSHPDKALYYSAAFEKPVNAEIVLKSQLHSAVKTVDSDVYLTGQAPDHVEPHYVGPHPHPVDYDEGKGMAFGYCVRVLTDGKTSPTDGGLSVGNASYITLITVTDTGFLGYDRMPDTDIKRCFERLTDKIQTVSADFSAALDRHVADFSEITSRQTLKLSEGSGNVKKLLTRAKFGKRDAELANIAYELGKYLIAAGSRDCQPLNLQGQWNETLRAPWSSNLTVNINYEMNYWGASACGLRESLVPFYNALREMAVSGRRTAQTNFGLAKGFCVNHNVDIWRMTTPVRGAPQYMFSPYCGAWITNEAAAHAVGETGTLSGDILRITEESCEFILGYLTERDGQLVSCPSTSPEAWFSYNNRNSDTASNSAFDKGIIDECFGFCLKFSENEDLKERIKAAQEKLFGYAYGERGLCEWGDGFDCAQRGHRHFSPLYALYPGTTVKYFEGGKDLEGFRKLFEDRMRASRSPIGWSAAWASALAAKLHDGRGAAKHLYGLLKRAVYPNLFAYHPPAFFQIDGNLGFVGAVNAMLFYVENGVIEFLPALPEEWKDGEVTGQMINGVAVSIKWKDGKVICAKASDRIKVLNENIAENAVLENVETVSLAEFN